MFWKYVGYVYRYCNITIAYHRIRDRIRDFLFIRKTVQNVCLM